MQVEDVLRCSECAAPIKPNQERCEYCGYWLVQPKPVTELEESDKQELTYPTSIVSTGIEVMIAFILASIAGLIGINLFYPISNAIGKSVGGSIDTLLGQVTWIFVALVFVGVITFLGMLGKYVESEAL